MEPVYDDGLAQIFLGKDLDVLASIPDGTIDLVITSPPYNLGTTSGGGFAGTRGNPDMKMGKYSGRKRGGGGLAEGYGSHSDDLPVEEYELWQRTVLGVLWDKLTDTGAIFYNHKERVQDGILWDPIVVNPGLPLRQRIILARPGGHNFSPAHFCPTHEVLFLFAKRKYRLANKGKGISGFGTIWKMNPERSEHPAPFPLAVPMRAIQSSADVNVVLDPYVGSGTTLRAATDLGVRSIGIDNDPWSIALCRQRLSQMSLFAA